LVAGESYLIRSGEPEDLEFLWEMLHEAAHHRALSDPEISRYLKDWGRPGDAAVVAFDPDDGRIGAAWYRLMPAKERGYGFVDVSTPEVAVAIVADHRGLGIGRALLRRLLDTAESQGVDGLSLSVRRNNPAAVELYERSGFVKLFDIDSEYPSWVMKVDLTAHGDGRGSPLTEASATNEPRD
jgi:ribosomal protein S18 acetylase RimI-like enzyme